MNKNLYKVNKFQNGFQKNKSTPDSILTLDYLLKKGKNKPKIKRNNCLFLMDIKGAYDTVNRDVLFNKLNKIMPFNIIELFKELFNENVMKINYNGIISD